MYKQIQDARGSGNSFSVNHFLSQTLFVKGGRGGELRGAGGEEVVPSLTRSELMQMSGRSRLCGNRTVYQTEDFAATVLMMRGRSSAGFICQRSNRGNANHTKYLSLHFVLFLLLTQPHSFHFYDKQDLNSAEPHNSASR